jgi:hypothetical protein
MERSALLEEWGIEPATVMGDAAFTVGAPSEAPQEWGIEPATVMGDAAFTVGAPSEAPPTTSSGSSGPPGVPPTGDWPGEEPERPSEPVERKISAWISERADEPTQPLRAGETYTLNFQVARRVEASLSIRGNPVVRPEEVPVGGLLTDWVITARGIELSASGPEDSITANHDAESLWWTARFQLLIPEVDDSELRQLTIAIVSSLIANQAIGVSIFVGDDLYRELEVGLTIEGAFGADSQPATGRDVVHVPVGQCGLRPVHEGQLWLVIRHGHVDAKGNLGAVSIDDGIEWPVTPAMLSGLIENVRKSANLFRARWEDYLNDIDSTDLVDRLTAPAPPCDWLDGGPKADAAHLAAWTEVAVSPELRKLAHDGNVLYETVFPPRSRLHDWITALRPGDRLNISWLPWDANWIPQLPWGLMYANDLPSPGQPIDAMGFIGLRQRLGYTSHRTDIGSRALGRLSDSHRAYLMYWGRDSNDVIGTEAQWQHDAWRKWERQVFVPDPKSPVDRRTAVLEALHSPGPAPVTVLYMFCQCSVGAGNDPVLRFNNGAQPDDVIGRTDLGTTQLADRPLVFANACTTSASDPYFTNELQEGFFRRGCRAYLGTETKVPPRLASRFASIFFHYLYHKLDSEPMAAGEAVAQTRLFLWRQYRNIGGILYAYVNQYDLFVASDEDVAGMRV